MLFRSVASQIDSAMGKFGTIDEQLAWRKRNGGYDIVLYNDDRLNVPKGSGGTDGGFTISVDGWGPIIQVPTSGGGKSISAKSVQRAPVNTSETISDFVINGIWKKGSEWYRLFNAQYVHKLEPPSTIWDYSPKKYWNPDGEVDFYAYAPAGVPNLREGLYNNPPDQASPLGPPTLEYSMPRKIDGEAPPPGTGEPNPLPVVDEAVEDLLVAVQNRTPQTAPVPITFRHAFSRVSVAAKIHDDSYSNGYRIRITRVDLRSLYTKGNLTLKKDTVFGGGSTGIPMETTDSITYNGTTTLWKNLDNLANYRFKLLSTVIAADDYTQLIHTDDEVFVIPQVINDDSELYVEYNIYTYSPTDGEQYVSSATKRINIAGFASGFAFEIGRQYVLRIELEVP